MGKERGRTGLSEGLHRDLYEAAGNGTGVFVMEMQEKDGWHCVWEVLRSEKTDEEGLVELF